MLNVVKRCYRSIVAIKNDNFRNNKNFELILTHFSAYKPKTDLQFTLQKLHKKLSFVTMYGFFFVNKSLDYCSVLCKIQGFLHFFFRIVLGYKNVLHLKDSFPLLLYKLKCTVVHGSTSIFL